MTSFGERALAALPPGAVSLYTPAPVRRAQSALELCRAALREPVDGLPLESLAAAARRIVVIVSDATREEPRAEMLTALRESLAWQRVTLVVASGTHQASDAVIPAEFRRCPVVVFGADTECVELGVTLRGTPVALARVLVEADLVVATGRLRPHYFAGYSAGAKSVFPGCARPSGVLVNHLLKAEPSARLGRVEDNVCRLDMEEAAGFLPPPLFVLNVLADVDGNPVAAAAGSARGAHRALVPRARELFEVQAPRSSVVVVSDRPPVSESLYQASKLLPPAGALLEPGGVVILCADLRHGIGPLERVNRGIYELGVRPQLPPGHAVWVVSERTAEELHPTYAEPRPSLGAALAEAKSRFPGAEPVALWRAGEMVVRAG